jgi:hypothetical protein
MGLCRAGRRITSFGGTNANKACRFETYFLFSMSILDEDTDVAKDGQNNYERIRVVKARRNLYNGLKLQK